ncbi:hypothetical protein [uncultured Campylobacter sp.]|nr:hypothetical protein [uncultured Campylobacter sp.]
MPFLDSRTPDFGYSSEIGTLAVLLVTFLGAKNSKSSAPKNSPS